MNRLIADKPDLIISVPASASAIVPSYIRAKQAGVRIGVAKKGLIVTGSNCLAVGINAIKAGTEYGTATQAPQVEAALAVKVGAQILSGGTPPKVSYVHEDRITKANVAKFTKVCTF
jgi:ABC-type sugar transport system substrate-binding protein